MVFDNGLTTDWDPLQQQLSGLTRVCSYDPARQNGAFGRSDPAPAPRTATDRVGDLHALLAAARVPGPYVLAGHSNGGLFDLLYASQHPQQVAGLVLIDGVHPGYHRRDIEVIKPFFPPELAAAGGHRLRDPAAADRLRAGRHLHRGGADRGGAVGGPCVRCPCRCSATARSSSRRAASKRRGTKLWTQLQAELAALLPGSHHVVAPTSDHDIHLVHPQLFIDEVTAVVEAVRAGQTTLTG